MIRLYIANTDLAWFNFLSQHQPLDEVNHWQPDFASFKSAIARLNPENRGTIGFRVLTQPVFLPKDEWFEPPSDWPTHVQGGKRYCTDTPEGRDLWERLGASRVVARGGFAEPAAMFGAPTLVRPRLGQGAFRVGVIEAYDRRCIVTGERTLPALEAAHIVPVTQTGVHEISNGLLLRRDLHALFDQHYITITPDKTVVVSRRIREEFENGREYYALDGRRVRDPRFPVDAPSVEALRRHNDLFVG